MSTVSKTSAVVEDSFIIECYCSDAPAEKTLVVCALCEKSQHAKCVNFRPKPFQEVPYLCAHCWTLNEKIQSKATLIVVPQSILNQWIEEVIVVQIQIQIQITFYSEHLCYFFDTFFFFLLLFF